ncbi:MAG: tetratricopeptide repeat protein [Gammaproteobacteria bacterium]|nr:tetratricopeptide repeat protein [Gammaproteobacteria bacterium]
MLKNHDDSCGLSFTASSIQSVESFQRLTTAYMGLLPETGDLLKELCRSDPDMPMALCTKGYFAKLIGSASHSARAKGISDQLNRHIAAIGANPREQQHAAALAAWCEGRLEETARLWESILLEYPRDGMAVRLAHFMHFYIGDGRQMRDSIARVLPRWPERHVDYGFMLGMYAFGLEESGEVAQAEKYGRSAVMRNPRDAWSVHAVAHVLEMTERHQEGIEWISGREKDWSTVNNFRFHLYWHQCLYHLERGELDSVLRLYDEQIVSDIESEFYLDMCNATSLLWRLEMFGVDVGARWHRLAAVAKNHVDDADLVFVSLHYYMALICAGDREGAERMVGTIREWSRLETTQARICGEVGLALAQGLKYARNGEHAKAVVKMEPVRYALDQIGGSKAQRDVFHMILLDMVQSSQDALKARALFAERLGHKPHSSWAWKHYGNILDALGEDDGAKDAAMRASEVMAPT